MSKALAIEAGGNPRQAAAAPAAQELPPPPEPPIIAIHDNAATASLLQGVFAPEASIVTYKTVADVAPAPSFPPKLVVVDLDSKGAEPATLGLLRMKAGFADVKKRWRW